MIVAKVLFEREDLAETLNAERVGPDLYRIHNIPFFADSVSLLDVVTARTDADGMLRFESTVSKSGHRTLRCRVASQGEHPNQMAGLPEALAARGVGCEGSSGGFMSLDIPPAVAIDEVIEVLLNAGWDWEHADPPPPDAEV